MQRQFHRPMDFDPSMAAAARQSLAGGGGMGGMGAASGGMAGGMAGVAANAPPRKTFEQALKQDFGFEGDSDEEDGQQQQQQQHQQQQYQTSSTSQSSSSRGSPKGSMAGGGQRSISGYPSSSAYDPYMDYGDDEEGVADEDARNDLQEQVDRLVEQLQIAKESQLRAESNARRAEERVDELQRMSKQAQQILVKQYKDQMAAMQTEIDDYKAMLAEDDETIERLRIANKLWEEGDEEAAREAQGAVLSDESGGATSTESRMLQRENVELKAQLEHTSRQLQAMQEEHERSRDATADQSSDLFALKQQLHDHETHFQQQTQQMQRQYQHDVQQLQQQVQQLQNQLATANANVVSATAAAASAASAATAATATATSSNSSEANGGTRPDNMVDVVLLREAEHKLEEAQHALKHQQTEMANLTSQIHALKREFEAERLALRASADSAAAAAAASAAAAAAQAARQENASQVDQALAAERQQLHVQIHTLQAELKTSQDSLLLFKMSAEQTQVERDQAAEKERADLTEKVEQLNDLLKKSQEESRQVKEKAKEKLNTASEAIKKLKTEYGNLRTVYTKLKSEASTESMTVRQLIRDSAQKRKLLLTNVNAEMDQVKAEMQTIRADLLKLPQLVHTLQPIVLRQVNALLDHQKEQTAGLVTAYRKEVALRKQYFNQLQELKGNIRVYCRVRPLSQREVDSQANCVTFPSDEQLSILNAEKKTTHMFEFEQVFQPQSTQEEVFAQVSDVIVSVMDGYNVCIFAYGQTGTGKTYTMQGPKTDPGVNIRALSKLFQTASDRSEEYDFDIKISLLEIYNEKILDLLSSKGTTALKAVQGQHGMEVQDLTYVPVKTQEEVLDTLARGSKNRKVSATNMNADSSRSHLILSVYVLTKNKFHAGKEFMGKLHLIDLAGSERVGRSGVTGDALKEAQSINSSLSALGNVIAARAAKNAHVPYRDSTLTYLLQDSLEKNSKTLMFVQVSPNASDSGESICSLRFAERVKKVELGKATANASGGASGAGAVAKK